MKTLGRILIILAVFAAVMSLTYWIVNAGGSSTNLPAFGRDGREPQFSNNERPEFPSGRPADGERHEFGREGERGGGWMFGLVKNIGVIAVVVVLITLTRNFRRKRPASVPVE